MKVIYTASHRYIGYWISVPGYTFGFIDHSSSGWHFAGDVRVFRTRKEATKALIAPLVDEHAWCPACQKVVEAEGRYNHEMGGHSVCMECNQPIEEITA